MLRNNSGIRAPSLRPSCACSSRAQRARRRAAEQQGTPADIRAGRLTTQIDTAALALSATASSGLPVSFNSLTTTVCTVSGNTAALITTGICSIQASQAGNSTYAPANPVTQTFDVVFNSATNRGVDTVTQGTWTHKYGPNGYLASHSSSDPLFTRLDSTARVETISLVDATSKAVLDTETFSGFHNGEYATWNVQGHVLIQVKKVAGGNAVVGGIFFDTAPTSSATYTGLDATTQGNWVGKYGADGTVIATYLNLPPAYATVNLTGAVSYDWADSTTDVRALQNAGSVETPRIAETFYSGDSFTIDLNLTDGNTHRISLYILDWDSSARAETVSIVDANSNTFLDGESYSNFHDGEYAIWNIKGHVVITVTRTAAGNAVVSGIFFN